MYYIYSLYSLEKCILLANCKYVGIKKQNTIKKRLRRISNSPIGTQKRTLLCKIVEKTFFLHLDGRPSGHTNVLGWLRYTQFTNVNIFLINFPRYGKQSITFLRPKQSVNGN